MRRKHSQLMGGLVLLTSDQRHSYSSHDCVWPCTFLHIRHAGALVAFVQDWNFNFWTRHSVFMSGATGEPESSKADRSLRWSWLSCRRLGRFYCVVCKAACLLKAMAPELCYLADDVGSNC